MAEDAANSAFMENLMANMMGGKLDLQDGSLHMKTLLKRKVSTTINLSA